MWHFGTWFSRRDGDGDGLMVGLHLRGLFHPKLLHGSLHFASAMTQLHLLLPRPGTKLPLTSSVLLRTKLQTRLPLPCAQFGVRHARPQSGRGVPRPGQPLGSSSAASPWATSFPCPPPWQLCWCCAADCLALTVPDVALCSGEVPVNPATGGGCKSVGNKQDLLYGVVSTVCPGATKSPSAGIIHHPQPFMKIQCKIFNLLLPANCKGHVSVVSQETVEIK